MQKTSVQSGCSQNGISVRLVKLTTYFDGIQGYFFYFFFSQLKPFKMETTAISLVKGQKVDLTKGTALAIIAFGLGWDVNNNSGSAFDLDAFAFATVNGKFPNPNGGTSPNLLFFGSAKDSNGRLNIFNGALTHSGDNLTGQGDGDDETIVCNLSGVPQEVDALYICLNIYQADSRRQNFGMVRNAFCRVYDTVTNEEKLRYDISENFSSETALIAGKLYRYNGEWKFEAIGEAFNGDINTVVSRYL